MKSTIIDYDREAKDNIYPCLGRRHISEGITIVLFSKTGEGTVVFSTNPRWREGEHYTFGTEDKFRILPRNEVIQLRND